MNFNRVSLGKPLTDDSLGMPESEDALCFGPFVLFPQQHLLLKNSEPVPLGSRALLLLITMASRPGTLLEKAELLALVWPKAVVEECNLRAQIVSLRRALEDDGDFGCIVTVPGRGYRFVAPVTNQTISRETPPAIEASSQLPSVMGQVIGRDALLDDLQVQIERRRFVTLTGPGGIGKTTVALALANRLLGQYPQGVRFIDLAPVSRGSLVNPVIASALGINYTADQSLQVLSSHLAQHKALLILDNCEHVLEETATAVEAILRYAPQCTVLITSREPLHAEGEFVHDLAPLKTPVDGSTLTAAEALAWPAIRLLVERIAAHDLGYQFQDQDVQAAANICRKLDGNALAIEIAAARVRAFGIAPLVEMLDGSFRLQMTGRRTALPRHRTLGATLDWTYSVLSPQEQSMLRQLSVFTGLFSLRAIMAVVNLDAVVAEDLAQLLESLMDKSLVTVCEQGSAKYYRLLETTRLYAAEKLAQHEETNATAQRLASYALEELKHAEKIFSDVSVETWFEQYGWLIDTVQAALNWADSANGNVSMGAELTLASIPLWRQLSLFGEGNGWISRVPQPSTGSYRYKRPRNIDADRLGQRHDLTCDNDTKIRQTWQLGEARRLDAQRHSTLVVDPVNGVRQQLL